MANVTAVNAATWENEVEQATGAVVVDFTASWCPPCKALAPVLEQVAADYAGRAKVVKVDIDENSALAAQYGVSSIPNLLFFKDGQVVNQAVGFQNEERLKSLIDAMIAS
jgi:thioredoxin 1